MKQQIPPAAIVAAIVVVLAIAGFFGFRAMGPDKSANPNAPHGMTDEQKAQYESMSKNGNGAPGHSSSGSAGYPSGGGGGQGSGGYPGSGGH